MDVNKELVTYIKSIFEWAMYALIAIQLTHATGFLVLFYAVNSMFKVANFEAIIALTIVALIIQLVFDFIVAMKIENIAVYFLGKE